MPMASWIFPAAALLTIVSIATTGWEMDLAPLAIGKHRRGTLSRNGGSKPDSRQPPVNAGSDELFTIHNDSRVHPVCALGFRFQITADLRSNL